MTVCKNCDTQNPSDNSFCQNCGEPLGETDTIGGIETPVYTSSGSKPKSGAATELQEGAVFAERYTIIEKIGQGGMGTVYRASETLAGRERQIALKLIRSDRLADQRAIDKLVSEGALTQDIRNPNVVNVYNVGVSDGQPFVAMEFVKGVSLRDWHRKRMRAGQDVPFDTAASIVLELLDGLQAAHALDIIHRDLKPENVMLTSEPQGRDVSLKILDFGIARAPGTIETGTGLGTPHYMAPEQITNPDAAGPPADFYSVFKIWYELLMDVLPQGHWQPPSTGRPDVEPLVDQLIERGLSAKPSRRPQDVAQFRKWMNTAMPGLGIPGGGGRDGGSIVPPPPPPPPPVDPETQKQAVKIAGFGCAGLLGLVLVIAVIQAIAEGDYDEPALPEDGPDVPVDIFADDDVDPVEEPDPAPPPPPPPPPPANAFAVLDGRWNTEPTGWIDMTVDANGNFSGSGRDQAGAPVRITGSIPGESYQIGNNSGSLSGVITMFNACHFDFTTFNRDGSRYAWGRFHIDHEPGDTECPARFNN